jgi:hypothetical protein
MTSCATFPGSVLNADNERLRQELSELSKVVLRVEDNGSDDEPGLLVNDKCPKAVSANREVGLFGSWSC